MDLIKKYKFPIVNISQFYPRPGTVANRMKQLKPWLKKKRSKEITALFESYKHMDHMQDREERVYITEKEDHKKEGLILVGHTQNYSKVTIPFEEGLIGKQVIIRITKCLKWHVSGEIVDRSPPAKVVADNYFDGVRAIYAGIKAKRDAVLAQKKEERTLRMRALRKKAQVEMRAKINLEKKRKAEEEARGGV